jgi:hypothetical protein
MVYKRYRDVYRREAAGAYAVSVIPNDATETYQWGIIGDTSRWPSPFATLENSGVAVNEQEVADDQMWKEFFECTGSLHVAIQDGILIQAVMGGSSTAGGGPYTHTITPPAAVAGVLPELPSFTLQHERYGDGVDPWSTQFLGVKIGSLLLTSGFKQRRLICRANWIGKKDDDVAFQMAGVPDLPATKNIDTYKFANMTRTWDVDGTPLALDGLEYMELLISPDFEEERTHSWDDVAGDYTGDYLRTLIESPMKRYEFKMNYMPTSSVIYKELKETGGTKKMEFQWTRAANDYIKLTLTDCYLSGHVIATHVKGQPDLLECTMTPRKVEFEVKDLIPGSAYGE